MLGDKTLRNLNPFPAPGGNRPEASEEHRRQLWQAYDRLAELWRPKNLSMALVTDTTTLSR